MSYNGIGLQTPRGSGTNGHIQRNMSSMRQREPYSVSQRREEAAQGQHQASRRADLGIVQHEAKRLVESQVMQYRIQLESQEEVPAAQRKTEEDLDRLVDLKRKELLSQSAARKPSAQEAGSRGWQTHGDAVRKEAELEKMRSVLRLRADYVEGTAMANQDERRKQRMERGQATEQGETRHPLDRTRPARPPPAETRSRRRSHSRSPSRSSSRPRHRRSRRRSPSSSRSRSRPRSPGPTRRRHSDTSYTKRSTSSDQRARRSHRRRSPYSSSSRSRSPRRNRRRRPSSSRSRSRSPSKSAYRKRVPRSRSQSGSPDPRAPVAGKEVQGQARGRARTRSPSLPY